MAITRKFYELKNEVEENLSKSDRRYIVSIFEDVLDHIFISSIKELVDYVTCFKCLDDYCILEMKVTDKLRHKIVDKEFKVFLYNVVTLCGLNGLDCSNVLSFNVIKIFFKLKDVDLCQRFNCDKFQLTRHVHYVDCDNKSGILIELNGCINLFILKEHQLGKT